MPGRKKPIDLTSQVFTRLTVIEYAGSNSSKLAIWRCRCICGNEVIACGVELRKGKKKSCGCLPKKKIYDLVGQTFGRLKVHEFVKRENHNSYFLCSCECGVEKIIASVSLRNGNTRSCGCLQPDRARAAQTTHGMTGTPEYTAWFHVKKRCTDPRNKAYHHYGGRGITMCERWKDFEAFLADMGTRPEGCNSIDRIDVEGNYEPGNCRWATAMDQQNNKRNNVRLEFRGRVQTISQWARELDVSPGMLWKRIFWRQWSIEKALATPPLRLNMSQRKNL